MPTNAITLNFDGTLDFNENNLTITDTSKVTVNYDSDNSGSNDTELKINSLGNNVYDTSKYVDGVLDSSNAGSVYEFGRSGDLCN